MKTQGSLLSFPLARPAAGLPRLLCGWLAGAVLLLTAAPPARAALIGYWNFDEGAGTTATDTSGRVGPLNGTLSAAAGGVMPAWVPGRFGNALNFNFTSLSAGGLVTVPFNGDLRLSNAFTISFWWRPDYVPAASTFPGIMRIGSQSAVPPAANAGWGYFRSQPNVPVHKRGNHQPAVYSAMTVGQWHHIALTHNGAGANVAFFNGAMVNFTTNWPGLTTTANFEFGRMDSFDDAGLDDTGFFNETISAAKVRSIYTVPNSLILDYNLAKMRSLWAIFDGGPGSSGTVDGSLWSHTTTLPGSTTLGDAYLSGTKWYVVLGAGAGLVANAILLGDVSPAGVGTIGTQTFPETPTIGATARFVFDLSGATTIGSGINDLLEITGDLNLSNNTVVINPLAPLATGTYRLINYTGVKNNSFNPAVVHNSRYSVALDETVPGQINLNVSGGNGDVRWFSASSGVWDVSAMNWSNTVSMALDRFFQADTVSFDDAAVFQTNLSLSAPMFPAAMTVSSATLNYSFSGSPIGGLAGGLTKNGAGQLSLNSANTFLGPLNLNGGTLRLGSASALGRTNGGTIIASGATLDLGGFAQGFEPVTLGGAGLSGTGAVINTGTGIANDGLRGVVTLTGDTLFGGPNRWDVFGGTFNGGGFKLTKSGASEIALSNLRDTGLGEIDVQRGQLTILGSTTMGDPTKAATVRPGATLAHWASGTNIHNKPIVMESARLLNATSPADNATNIATVSLTGTNTFDGASSLILLGNVIGPGAVVKNGTGALRLGGANTYSGNTTVNAGTLALINMGTIDATPLITLGTGARLNVTARVDGTLTLASGQTLAGAGMVEGSLIAGTGAGVAPGFSPATLTVTNALNLSGGATLTYELGAATTEGAGVNDLINVGGPLNLGGTTTLRIVPLANLVVGTPYTLINHTGALSGSAANFTATSDSRYSFTVDTATPGKVQLTAAGSAAFLEWVGDDPGNPTAWDTRTTPNWLALVPGEQFFSGDSVVFNDFAVTFNVNLAGDLYPAATVVESTVDYVFSGAGRIRGGGLTKNLEGRLLLANTGVNDYPGPTIIGVNGVLEVGTGGTFGNLGPNVITNDGQLVLHRSDDFAFPNTLFGSGAFVKKGANVITAGNQLAGFNGAIVIDAGLFRPTTTNGVGTAAGGTTVNAGSTLDLNALNIGLEPITAAGAGIGGNGAIVNNAGGQNNALRFVTLSGDTTIGGVGRWDVRNLGAGATFTGNGFSLVKTGANQVSLVSVGDANLGALDVRQGTLSIEGNTGLGTAVAGGVGVQPGATLFFFGSTVPHEKPVALNGGARIFKDNGTVTLTGPISLSGSNALEAANNAGTDFTLAGPVSGGGQLTKLGAGNVILALDSSHSGGTLIAAGVLQVGTGAAVGSVPGSVTANGIFSIHRSDTLTLANNVTGAGGMYVRTANGLILDGTAAVNLGGAMEVGHTVQGKLIIKPGAAPVVGRMMLGNIAGTQGDVIQEGGDVWVTLESRVGHWANNTSTYLLGGGSFNVTNVPAGVVNQAGVAEQNGILYLGIDGTGVFVQTGGVLRAHGIVLDGRGNTAGDDTFHLIGGTTILGPSGLKSGTLDANQTYQINLGGGTLSSASNWATALRLTLTGSNGNVTLNPSASLTNTLNGWLAGPGGLTKDGAGTVLVNNPTNAFTGTLAVNGGTLGGTGTISGPLVVGPGGTLAPGLSIGTLSAPGGATLQGATLMEINKTGAVLTGDKLAAASIAYGGTLQVVATGDPLANGDAFQLFVAPALTGEFDSLLLPSLPPDLFWDPRRLGVDGTLSVTTNLPPEAGRLSISTTKNRPVNLAGGKIVIASPDPLGDPVSLVSVSNSTNGALVTLLGGTVTYTPVADYIGADLFQFTVADHLGLQAIGEVEVLVYPGDVAGVNVISLLRVGDDFHFTFAGIPGRAYGVERALMVNGPWTQIATVVCDADGVVTFIDTASPPGSAFYRTVYPAAP
jgi:autotransporter-associated beta strand protein